MQLENHVTEEEGDNYTTMPSGGNSTPLKKRPGPASGRGGNGLHLVPVPERPHSKATPTELSCQPLHKESAEEVRLAAVPTRAFQKVSLSGVVDAILEVGNQRRILLDQLRSVLLSGNDAEALGLARQLCGIQG